MLHKMKLSTRIMMMGIVIILAFSGVFVWLYPEIKKDMFNEKYHKTRNLVESAYSVIGHYSKEWEKGKLSESQAKTLAMEAVESMRYEEVEYFSINNTKGIMLMHPVNKKLVGQDVSNLKDTDGVLFMKQFSEIALEKGSGFVNYNWVKPGETTPSPKITFVKYFKKWDWVVASGIYVDDVNKEVNTLFMIIGLVGLAISVFSLLVSWIMSRAIAKPIHNIIEGLNRNSDHVASAAGQVSTASQSLAEGSSEQSSSIEETSSSLEEMSAMTRQSSENATSADNFMKDTEAVVKDANMSMNNLMASMEDISATSDEMSRIIKTIEEIAFQTNLLALNAAVEAARAGSAGAGFAVVAGEVRNLAIRSAEAAKNTSAMLEETVSKISTGSSIVNEANEIFQQIAESSVNVGKLVDEIATGSNEQAMGIAQVNQAVAQIGQVVQENAANAEESASASEEMASQARLMKDIVQELARVIEGSGKLDRALTDSSDEPG